MKQPLKDGSYPCGKGQGWIHISCNGDDIMWTTHKEHHDPLMAQAIAVTYRHDKLFLAFKSHISMYVVHNEEATEVERTIKEKVQLAYTIDKRKIGKRMPSRLLKKNDLFYIAVHTDGDKWRVTKVMETSFLAHKLKWCKSDIIKISYDRDVIFAGRMSKIKAFFLP